MTGRIVKWIDQRFPLTSFVKHELTGYPTPRNLSYWWNFGFLAGFVLVLQVATGIFLAMHYKADVALSFDSIQHIMRDVNYGWLLRYMHATGASAFFFVIFVHMARTLYYGSYRAPRELLWWTGQGLLLLLMATAFMGYLLPWGQMSFWGATVITNLFRATPFFGDQVVIWLRGDYTVGDATLTRFFALHYLFPFLIIGAVVVHLVALHTVKSSNPSGIDLAHKDNIPFHPVFHRQGFLRAGNVPDRVQRVRVLPARQPDRAGQQHPGRSRCRRRTTSCPNGISCRSTPSCVRCPTWSAACWRWACR